MKTVVVLLASIFLCSCVGMPSEVANRPAEKLMFADINEVAGAYGSVRATNGNRDTPNVLKLKNELERRGGLSASEWMCVFSQRVAIGMSQVGVLAAMGNPHATRAPSTTSDGSTVHAYMYMRGTKPDVVVWFKDWKVSQVDGMHVAKID